MTEQKPIEYIVQGMQYSVFISLLVNVENSAEKMITALENSMDLQERADGKALRQVLTEVSKTIDDLVTIDNQAMRGLIPPVMAAFLIENHYAPIKEHVLAFGELAKVFQQHRAPKLSA